MFNLTLQYKIEGIIIYIVSISIGFFNELSHLCMIYILYNDLVTLHRLNNSVNDVAQ